MDEVVGQEHVKKAVAGFEKAERWPKVFLFYGPPGTGKTTVAEILAAKLQPDPTYIFRSNASLANKVDDARELEEQSYSRPFNGIPAVFILNEFDRFTSEAQKGLKDPLEVSGSTFILTSNNPEKIDPAIKSRASAGTFEFNPLKKTELATLISKTAVLPEKVADAVDFLYTNGVTSPREIYGVLEQHATGVPLQACIHRSEHEPLYADIARSVLSGNWVKAAGLLKEVKTIDSRAMTGVLSVFLKNRLLDCEIGPQADALAACLVGIDNLGYADGTAYGAVVGLLYKTSKVVGK
jgi:hypothetical protein